MTMKHHAALILIALLALPFQATAQKKLVENRSQATGWYVPVKFKVTAQGARAKGLGVKVYKDNQLLHDIIGAKDKFTLNLDLENGYTVILSKEGYRSKSVHINTHVPEQVVQYPAYECTMNLEPADHFTHSDPFYMDFPSAIVRWNDASQGFMPQQDYLRDIQAKMAMLQVQMDPH